MDEFRRDGLRFDVLDTGPADGPVVLLLHGFPEFAGSWSEVTRPLTEQGYRCLAPDQRGYSPGARPRRRRDYRMADLADDVLSLVDASGAGRVHLVGHDWGAAVSWAFAMRHPHRLASLSALSVPHPGGFVHSMLTRRQGLASWYMYGFQIPRVPELIMLGRRGDDAGRMVRSLRSFGQSESLARRTATAMVDRGALPTALNWYRALPLADPRSNRTPVDVPTLFVWSDGDKAVLRPSAEACRAWVTGPYRFEVLAGVSHWMLDEAPDEVARLLLEQFAAHPA